MQENWLTFLLHIKKLITQIGSSHPIATSRVFSILCWLPWLLIKNKTLQPSRLILASEVPMESSYPGEGGDYVLKGV